MERRCKLATISSHSSTRTCITRCVDHSGDSSAGLRVADMTHHCERVYLACELLTNRKIFSRRRGHVLTSSRRSHVARVVTRAACAVWRGYHRAIRDDSAASTPSQQHWVFFAIPRFALPGDQHDKRRQRSARASQFIKCALSTTNTSCRANFLRGLPHYPCKLWCQRRIAQ